MQKLGKMIIISMIVMMAVIGIASAVPFVPTDPGAATTTEGVIGIIRGPYYGTDERDINCAGLGYVEILVDGEPVHINPDSGTIHFDGGREITVNFNQASTLVDFTSNFDVGVVIVKAGNYANVFVYPDGVMADTGLHGPVDQNGGYHAISHIEFCNPSNVPEFPAIALPVGMVIGFLGVVTVLRGKE